MVDDGETYYLTDTKEEFDTEGLRNFGPAFTRYDRRRVDRVGGQSVLTPANPGYGLRNPLTARSEARVTDDGFLTSVREEFGRFHDRYASGTYSYNLTRNATTEPPAWQATAREQAPRFGNVTRTDSYVAVTVAENAVPAGTRIHTTTLETAIQPGSESGLRTRRSPGVNRRRVERPASTSTSRIARASSRPRSGRLTLRGSVPGDH